MAGSVPLQLLDAPSAALSGGMGIPSINGGDAGPSNADGTQNVTMNNPFSVAASGGKANSTATSNPDQGFMGLGVETIAFLAAMAVLVAVVVRKS